MKRKILFIVSDFYHGGAQREMFEIDRVVDKSKVELGLLSIMDLGSSKHFPDFFYEQHLALETKVVFKNSLLNYSKLSLQERMLRKLGMRDRLEKNKATLKQFLAEYDQVVFMGEYVYQHLIPLLTPDILDPIVIFVMSARFQGENYRDFKKDNHYLFISGFDRKEEVEYEFEGFANYQHIPLLLSLQLTSDFRKWKFGADKEVKKIGIFTRLSKAKPLDPFFYAFHVLLNELPNVELHVFGAGDYKEAGYDRYINHLGLNEKVHFRGHLEDMKTTINQEQIDVTWLQGYHNKPAGFGGLEVCLTGTPMLLWDYFTGDNPMLNNLDNIYPHFKDLMAFVVATKQVLSEEAVATKIAEKQFEDVLDNRDMRKNIQAIDKLLYG